MLMFFIAIGIVLASLFPFVVINQPVINWFLLFMADVVIIFGAWIFKKDFLEKNLFSPRAIFSGLTILHFGFPSILLSYENSFVNKAMYADINSAIFMVLISLLFYYWGYQYIYGKTKHLKLAEITPNFNEARIKKTIVGLFVAGYISRFFIILSGGYFQISRATQVEDLKGPFYSIFYTVEEFPLYALCLAGIALWAKREKRTKRSWGIITLTIAISELLYWLISGRKEQTLMAFLYPLIVYNIMTLKIPSKKVILTFLIFLILYFPFNFYYRYLLQAGGLGALNPVEVLTNPEFLLQLTEIEDVSNSESGGLLERINLMESITGAVSIKDNGKWNAFPGENYFSAVYSIVPRFLWAGKPEFHYGNEFGHAVGILYPRDDITSISVTFIGEAYLNFSYAGVIVIGFFGIFFAYFYKLIFTAKNYLTWLFIYLTILPTLLYFGGTFTLYFGGLIKLVPFSYLIGYYCSKK